MSTLRAVYQPGLGQSGYGGVTWGDNYQQLSKSGRSYGPEEKGERPCPDFGVVHLNNRGKFSLLGEVKYVADAASLGVALPALVRDMVYYLGLPSEPEKRWDYDFGFGLAYAAGGEHPREATLMLDHWDSHRFVVAAFQA